MPKGRRSVETTSMAFLDLLSCALGGTLLLLLLSQQQSSSEKAALEEDLYRAEQRIQSANEEITKAESSLKEMEIVKSENVALKRVRAALSGLEGELKNVAFVVDLSGSMVGLTNSATAPNPAAEKSFQAVKDRIKQQLLTIPCERISLVGFGGDAKGLARIEVAGLAVEADDTSRRSFANELQNWDASGGTPTSAALQKAFSIPNLDTIILYSDGSPSIPIEYRSKDGRAEAIRARAEAGIIASDLKARNPNVTVNTIGIGVRSGDGLIDFLKAVASKPEYYTGW